MPYAFQQYLLTTFRRPTSSPSAPKRKTASQRQARYCQRLVSLDGFMVAVCLRRRSRDAFRRYEPPRTESLLPGLP